VTGNSASQPAPRPSARVPGEPGFAVLERRVGVEGAEDQVVVREVVERAVHVVGAERLAHVPSLRRGLGEVVDDVVRHHGAEVVTASSAARRGERGRKQDADDRKAGEGSFQ
jgi:hypothetical protein